MIEHLWALRNRARQCKPLVHCLSNHITSYVCANMVLAAGGRPIMAEHPAEVEGVTAGADALLLNLGNISDERMRAMELAAAAANKKNVPIVLDAVGVGCSTLRLQFAKRMIELYRPDIIKGNRSEIRSLTCNSVALRGVDADEVDLLAPPQAVMHYARQLAQAHTAAVLVSGPTDVMTDGLAGWQCDNGTPIMGEVCGTGCMLGALTATFAACGPPLEATVLAATLEGIAGELAVQRADGPAGCVAEMIDTVYIMDEVIFSQRQKIRMDEVKR